MVAHLIEVVQIVGIVVVLIPIIGLLVLMVENVLDTIECLMKKLQNTMRDTKIMKNQEATRNIK